MGASKGGAIYPLSASRRLRRPAQRGELRLGRAPLGRLGLESHLGLISLHLGLLSRLLLDLETAA